MSLSKHGAAYVAASKLTRTQVDATAARYLAWIEAQADDAAAIDALMSAADQSKNPDRVMALADALYQQLDIFPPDPPEGLPSYLQQSALQSTYVAKTDAARVATTGAYADLTGTPTIPSTPGQVGADAAGAASAAQAAAITAAATDATTKANSALATATGRSIVNALIYGS